MTNHLSHSQQTCPGNAMLQTLKDGLSPTQAIVPTYLKEPILVSIDVGLDQRARLDTIGIACLDTRSLAARTEEAVSTRLLLVRRRLLPVNTRTRQYLFGIPEHAPPDAARQILETTFRQVDPEQSRLRNIFLVGHNINSDLKYLKDTLDFSIESVPTIVAIIDTQQLARCVFNFRHKYVSLKQTLLSLGVQTRQLHNSGNDAVYTLKALIHLFCRYQTDLVNQSRLCVGRSAQKQDDMQEPLW